jgi:aryl-alcohol dehydrogenase-like predicted oxidoreductase
MLYRSFKGTNISEVGLGTWQLGSSDWGNVQEEEAFSILQTFIDNGGNFIDTADVYGNGLSEKVIGKFLASAEKEIHVATKLGRRSDAPFGMPQNFSYDMMRRQVEDSLKHLDLQELFLEQLHCIPADELKKGEVFNSLRKLKEEKLIRHWGVSVETSEEALLCMEQEGLSSLQIIFNLFRQHVADELFAKAKAKDVALIIRVPLASGLLTGKFKKDTKFSERDHRYYNAGGKVFNAGETFAGLDFSTGLALSKEIAELMPDTHTAQWAIRWILDHPEVTTVIPGASKPSQVETNMAASGFPPISKVSHQQLRLLYDEKIKNEIRGHY